MMDVLKTRIVDHEPLSGEFNLTELDNNHLSFLSKGGMWIWYPQNVTMKWEVSNSWWHDPFLMRTSRCISFAVSRQILYHRYGGLFEMMLSNSCLHSYFMLIMCDVYICIDYSHTHINHVLKKQGCWPLTLLKRVRPKICFAAISAVTWTVTN